MCAGTTHNLIAPPAHSVADGNRTEQSLDEPLETVDATGGTRLI